jgi:hypothetical protein
MGNAARASRRDYRLILFGAQASRTMVTTKFLNKPMLSSPPPSLGGLNFCSSGLLPQWTVRGKSVTMQEAQTLKRRSRMALSAHLQELSEKHRQLERRIEEETARPGSDDLAIRRLKQEKLKLKDEIFRLETETRH